MLAYTYEENGKFVLKEKEKPTLQSEDDAIVRVTLASICSSDLHIKHGAVPRAVPGITVGHEMVGIVEETGRRVTKVKPGDRVTVNVETFCGECFFCKNGFVNNCTDQNGGCALLLTYVLAVLAVTLLWRKGGTDSRLQMQLFTGVGEALQKHSLQPVWHMLQNVALFVPVGLLFPLIHPAFDHPGYAVMNGLMLSVWIETIQMITASGTCDVNDILTNTLGTAMGYGTFWIGRGMRK